MNEEVHKVLHDGVVERIEKLEHSYDLLTLPEEGTLAKTKQSMETSISKVEAKLNWLLILIFTGMASALGTILLTKLGIKG